MLIARRNVYLQRAAMAPFSGLTSGDSIVLRVKDDFDTKETDYETMSKLLPFILNSIDFWDYANTNADGTMSKRLSPALLLDYEFDLPSIEEQKLRAEKLWAAYEVKQSYLKMIKATQEMVQSQFIEEFGSSESTKPLADFIEVSFPGEWGQEDKNGDGVKVIRTTNFTNTGKLDLTDVVTRDIDAAKVEKKKLKKGDILLERSGGTNDNPVGRVVYFDEEGTFLFNNFTQLLRCKEGVNPTFLFYSLFNFYWTNKGAIRGMGNKTTGIQNLKMDKYWQIPIADVPIESQEEFESIYNQADKSEKCCEIRLAG
ncbi:MAG: restriction endonuclease subunit S [Bacteroidales bacterium]|nr:restriction endonuclease subunit S [Bacteroidales bacterium]